MSELELLRRFKWNVLQAYDRGGAEYLQNAVAWLIENPVPDPAETVTMGKTYADGYQLDKVPAGPREGEYGRTL